MKNIISILSIFLILFSCGSQKHAQNTSDQEEWEVVVFDADYENFVASRARPISMFSEETLKSRNRMLVSEWNSRFYSGENPNLYEVSIDYDPLEKYGLQFEYRLYQFFAYVSWKYGARFSALSTVDSHR